MAHYRSILHKIALVLACLPCWSRRHGARILSHSLKHSKFVPELKLKVIGSIDVANSVFSESGSHCKLPHPRFKAIRSLLLALSPRSSSNLQARAPTIHRMPVMGTVASEQVMLPNLDAHPTLQSGAMATSDIRQERVNLLGLSKAELQQLMKDWGFPAFRGKQVYDWIFANGVTDFDAMHTLPKTLRAMLKDTASIGVLTKSVEQVSNDGTVKRAYSLSDGQLIESVLMPYADGRRTACISSQAGCAMGCTFCATGQMGFARHLSAEEIFEQAMRFSSELKARGERLSNVVFMGMGEPLANYDNVLAAVKLIHECLGIGSRHITISTVGLVPQIRKLASEEFQLTLAVSLHASNDVARSTIMPVNRRFSLKELVDACRDYQQKTNRRITFEWALIAGQNDTPEVATELGRLLHGLLCHVNIIPLNPTRGSKFRPGSAHAMERFIKVLARYGISATPRTRRGLDIDAGCGQLTQKVARKEIGRL